MSKEVEYQASKIRPIVQIAARLVHENPLLAMNHDALWSAIVDKAPELKEPEECGGCGRSMKVSVYEADLLDALLILEMGKQVKRNLAAGQPFTEANRVHIPTLKTTQGVLKRQTKCDYLCLIKQPKAWAGSGIWVLTGWAWKALRGEEVPRAAKYWEGHLLGRSESKTTLARMFQTHNELVERAIAKRKAVKSDHREAFRDYKPGDWLDLSTAGIQFAEDIGE